LELRFFEIFRNTDYLWLLFEGTALSAGLTLLAGIIGFAIAMILAFLRHRRVFGIHWVAAAYVEFIRNTPLIVPMTDDARARFKTLSVDLTGELRAAAGTACTAILARIGENALKLALIVAVGRDPARPEIDITATDWAIDFVRYYAQRTMAAVERHVADTETEAHLKRLKEIIRAAGSKGITKSEITRASQWLKSRDRNEILETLIESGDITTGMRETGGRRAMVYRIVR
jgi:hypothetical protein